MRPAEPSETGVLLMVTAGAPACRVTLPMTTLPAEFADMVWLPIIIGVCAAGLLDGLEAAGGSFGADIDAGTAGSIPLGLSGLLGNEVCVTGCGWNVVALVGAAGGSWGAGVFVAGAWGRGPDWAFVVGIAGSPVVCATGTSPDA